MNKKSKIGIIQLIVGLMLALFASLAYAGDSRYAVTTSGTSAQVAFGPDANSERDITAVLASSDVASGTVTHYMLTDATNKFAVTTASTSGAQIVYFANAGQTVSTNDVIVYLHSNGRVLGTTVASGAQTGQVTLATGLRLAGTTNDSVYKLTPMGRHKIGTTALNIAGYTVLTVPIASPYSAIVTCNTNGDLTVTRK